MSKVTRTESRRSPSPPGWRSRAATRTGKMMRPNPYQTVEGVWAPLPDGGSGVRPAWWKSPPMVRRSGQSTAVAPTAASRLQGGHHLPVRQGRNILRQFGAGLFEWPHGIDVDRDGNVWVTDGRW